MIFPKTNSRLHVNANVRRPLALLSVLALLATALVVLNPSRANAESSPEIAWSWGSNSGGTLGDGTDTNSNVPVKVSTSGVLAGKDVTQVATGGGTACAVTSDGGVYCWGDGQQGQFGNGTSGAGTNFSDVPVAVDMSGAMAGKSVVQVGVGGSSVCARTTDGALYCWGDNTFGQLGTGDFTASLVPIATNAGPLSGLDFIEVAAGFAYACAVSTGGDAFCWGNGIYGQLGNGATLTSETPVAVTMGGLSFVSLGLGTFTSCAVTTDDEAYCWGRNNEGQVGDGTIVTPLTVPTAVSTDGILSGEAVVDIQPGDESTCAATASGTAVCWGMNDVGQLGDGTTDPSLVPVQVSATGGLAGKTVNAVSTSYTVSCAANSDGSTACWGTNNYGEFGDGTNISSLTPVAPSTTNQYFQGIVSGSYYTYAWGPSRPSITSVSPASGVISAGETVTIYGTALSNAAITIGGFPCTNVTEVSATELTCTAPSGPVGGVALVVTTQWGSASLANAFAYPGGARCPLTVAGARAAKKQLPMGKTVTLVKRSRTSAGCRIATMTRVTHSATTRGDARAAITVKVAKRTGKVTARAHVRRAKAVIRIQAEPRVGESMSPSRTWKRTYRS